MGDAMILETRIEKGGAARTRILLVEDEGLIALSEKMTLEQGPYSVRLAFSGAQAIEMVNSAPFAFDLILMDINLGAGIDGAQAAQEILAHHDLPILFISSHTDRETVEKTEKITSYGYVVKNSSPPVLFASIKMALKLFRANRKVQEAEAGYRALFENSLDAVAVHEIVLDEQGVPIDYVFLRVNAQFEQFTGLRAADILQRRASEVVSGLKETGLIDIYGKVALTGEPATLETYVEALAGYFSIRAYQAGPRRFATVFKNITPHDPPVFENSMNAILVAGEDGALLAANPAAVELFGYPRDQLLKLRVSELRARSCLEISAHYLLGGKEVNECKLIRPDGQKRVIQHFAAPIHDNRTLNIYNDITNLIAIEDDLRRSRKMLQEIIENSPAQLVFLDPDFNLVAANSRYARFCQCSLEELIGKNHFQFFPSAENETIFRQARDSGQPVSFYDWSFEVSTQTGRVVTYWDWTLTPVKDENGLVEGLVFSLVETTERARAAEYLRMYQRIVSSTPDGTAYLDKDYRFRMANDAYEMLSGKKREVFLGSSMAEYLGEEVFQNVIKQRFDRCLQGETIHFEDWFTFTILGKRYMHVTYFPYRDSRGEIIGVVTNVRDMTENKHAEEKIVELLREKELLLREIHHRVKNNMFSITSLLQLQIDAVKEEAAKLALQDAAGRIRSMGVLYNLLNYTGNIAGLSLKDYLPSLIDEIMDIFSPRQFIQLRLDVEDIHLKVDQLTTLGIIFNELLTNVMKYAFAGREYGKLTVSAKRSPGGIEIIFADDGVGLPEGVTFENSPGLGMQIVGMLVRQLNGGIAIHRGVGACFHITLPA